MWSTIAATLDHYIGVTVTGSRPARIFHSVIDMLIGIGIYYLIATILAG
jgi:hypothetical protein